MKSATRAPVFGILLALGLAIRLSTAFLYGTVDMEFWKAYTVYAIRQGVPTIYGASDDRIIENIKKGNSIEEVIRETQTTWDYPGYRTYYTSYYYHQRVQPVSERGSAAGCLADFCSEEMPEDTCYAGGRQYRFNIYDEIE